MRGTKTLRHLISLALAASLAMVPPAARAQPAPACEDPKVLRFSLIPTQEGQDEP